MSERTAIYEEKMGKTLKNLETELQSVRAGRANPHVLDKVTVDYYGSPTPIQGVATVAVPEPRMIQIQPWDTKLVKPIVKAIQKSDIGINPSDDGRVIRLIFPELTEERRTALVKKMGENSKVACRNIRRDGNDAFKKLKKKEEVSEDEIADAEEELQKITDKYIKKIDKVIEQKTKELMTI